MRSFGKSRQAVLFDWGDTVMRVFPGYSGPMSNWPRVEAMPGANEALAEIGKNADVALATNAASSGECEIRKALDRVGLGQRFDRVFCFETVGYRKPSVDFFNVVSEQLDLKPKNVFMVGDDFEIDVLGATAVGIGSVWLNLNSRQMRRGHLHTTTLGFDTLGDALKQIGFCRGPTPESVSSSSRIPQV